MDRSFQFTAGSAATLSPYSERNHFRSGSGRKPTFLLGPAWVQSSSRQPLGLGHRWVAVAPPDGTALLALLTPQPDSELFNRIGQSKEVVFITEDVTAKFTQWSERGVHFHHPPLTPVWGGMFTSFEDLDGNFFALVGFDEVSREIEAQRRAIAEELESERRTAKELEIAREVQARLFPQTLPPLVTLDYAGVCVQARQVGGDYYDFLDLGRERLGLVTADISGKGIAAAL